MVVELQILHNIKKDASAQEKWVEPWGLLGDSLFLSPTYPLGSNKSNNVFVFYILLLKTTHGYCVE